MADTAQLKYNTSLTVNLDVLAIHGAAEPDHVSKFPGIVHEMLDGSLAEQIAGGRREMSIDFQVMTATNRRKVVDWWLDPDRQIVCLVDTPTITSESVVGTLSGTGYYQVVAIDIIGHSASSNTETVNLTPLGGAKISWTAISGARCYKIYRKLGTAHWFAIDYTMELSYTDDGTIASGSGWDTGSSSLSLTISTISVITTNDLEFTWAYETELARMLHLELREASIFLSASGFPI